MLVLWNLKHPSHNVGLSKLVILVSTANSGVQGKIAVLFKFLTEFFSKL